MLAQLLLAARQLFVNHGEPFTHTGFLASRKLNDKVTVHAGWTDGWDDGWTNPNGASTFLGGMDFSLTDKSLFKWACNTGPVVRRQPILAIQVQRALGRRNAG